MERLKDEISRLESQLADAEEKSRIAGLSAAELVDVETTELERNITEVDEINRRVRQNLDKQRAQEDAEKLKDEYDNLSRALEEMREKRFALLSGAKMPIEGLTVENGTLRYHGQEWDCMSGSEQLIVGTSIVKALKPECGFVLIDKLEQMDIDTMADFGAWLKKEGLQAICTRVSTGEECTLIIEDGFTDNAPQAPKNRFSEVEF